MRQARFTQLYAGIETPEEDALIAMDKRQNLRSPILRAIADINSHGIEVASGVILGLDTDTPETYDRFCRFIDASNIPFLTINLLQALPHTPLWRRLKADGRLLAAHGPGDSNVDFLLPRDTVVNGWRQVVAAYRPDRLYARYLLLRGRHAPIAVRVAQRVLAMAARGGRRAASTGPVSTTRPPDRERGLRYPQVSWGAGRRVRARRVRPGRRRRPAERGRGPGAWPADGRCGS